jgi:hypothetical protein
VGVVSGEAVVVFAGRAVVRIGDAGGRVVSTGRVVGETPRAVVNGDPVVAGCGAGGGDPERRPPSRKYTATNAMITRAIMPIFFMRRRCFFFRMSSRYRAG